MDQPRIVHARYRTRGGDDWLTVRLLGGLVHLPAHILVPEKNLVPCDGPGCEYCRVRAIPAMARLAPVLHLEDAGPEPRWQPAVWKVNPQQVDAVGEFARGRVLKVRRLTRKQFEVVSEPEPEGPFDVPAFDVEPVFRAATRDAPRAKTVIRKGDFQSGRPVPVSGVYTATHGHGHASPTELICLGGDTFPQCNRCGTEVLYRFAKEVPYIADHPLFADLEAGPPRSPDETHDDVDD